MTISFGNYLVQPLNTSKPEAFFNLINENRHRLLHFFPGTSARTKTLDETKEYMLQVHEKMLSIKYLPYIITDTTTSKDIGMVDFKNIDWRVPKAEMGYLVDRHYEGRGIVRQAAALVIRAAVDKYKFRKILCRISPENPGSIHLARRLGFELEGNIRNDFVSPSGEPVDLHYYGRIF